LRREFIAEKILIYEAKVFYAGESAFQRQEQAFVKLHSRNGSAFWQQRPRDMALARAISMTWSFLFKVVRFKIWFITTELVR
jgi:hypothetical protein